MKYWIFWGLVITFISKNEADFKCNPSSFDSVLQNLTDYPTDDSTGSSESGQSKKAGQQSQCSPKSRCDMENVIKICNKPKLPQTLSCKCQKRIEEKKDQLKARCAMESIISLSEHGLYDTFTSDVNEMEDILEEINVETSTLFCGDKYTALLYRASSPFKGAEFHSDKTKTHVQNSTHELYEQRLVGLSAANKTISGLSERVNLTMSISLEQHNSTEPLCVFLDYSIGNWSSKGCQTLWDNNQSQVTCSCDHLTFFGVLLVPTPSSGEQQPLTLSSEDLQTLSYITLIGCGISLAALVFTVFLFFSHSKIRADDSKKVHINLVFALIFLNLHFLPNEKIATLSLSGLCLYMALALHYFLLATFTWMALEGFHLYLLIVKVFNIHINRYMLKISVIGWGVPAVIVSIVVSIKKEYYGLTNLSNSSMCYITDKTVKLVTTLGLFALLFVFNTIVFCITARYLTANNHQKTFGPMKKNRMQDLGILLALITLLGIAWGFIFFSFGPLATPVIYIFCILNSLQGFFIFLYFVLTLRTMKDSTTGKQTNSLNT